jgi:mycothiol synthase
MITVRMYTDEYDYEQMRNLLRESYQNDTGCDCTLGDLDWWRSAEAQPQSLHACLWFDDERLVGFGWPTDNQVDIVTHPHYRQLDGAILDWAEARHLANPETAHQPFKAWAYTRDTTRVQMLTKRDYLPAERALNFYQRQITASLPSIQLPTDYTVRNFIGMDEIEQRVMVHRDAFAPSKMTVARHIRAMNSPTYQMNLDLVVEAPDQSLAAFCIVWFDATNKMGIFEPVGCHSAHRRRGLASAAMSEGLRRLARLGATIAHVNADVSNPQSNALYTSLGFELVDRNQSWQLFTTENSELQS